jgi:hypothetical protein
MVLLVAAALLAIEAGTMLILGPARGIVIKPFILLGYLEACAVFFSLIGIVCAILGLIFYHPYRYISEKIMIYRARRTPEVSDDYTYFEDVNRGPDEEASSD